MINFAVNCVVNFITNQIGTFIFVCEIFNFTLSRLAPATAAIVVLINFIIINCESNRTTESCRTPSLDQYCITIEAYGAIPIPNIGVNTHTRIQYWLDEITRLKWFTMFWVVIVSAHVHIRLAFFVTHTSISNSLIAIAGET